MIQITSQMKIFVCITPIDFRHGMDRLKEYCKTKLKEDPYSGALFVSKNKLNCSLKILAYDGEAFWLCQRRLSSGKMTYWPNDRLITPKELQVLIMNGNPTTSKFSDDWKRLI